MQLRIPDYRAVLERGPLITVDAFDWHCPQYIPPRYTLAEIDAARQINRRFQVFTQM